MLNLYLGSGSAGFDTDGRRLPLPETKRFIANTIRLLNARGSSEAAKWLETVPFEIVDSSNIFQDSFHILFATVNLPMYENLRQLMEVGAGKSIFSAVAETLTEIGPYIRFVAVELQLEAAANFSQEEQHRRLKQSEIYTLVNRYIGVQGGYLADFNYRSHHDFYINLDLDINPNDYLGTTRQRFINIISESTLRTQAKILEGILERFPIGSSDARTDERAREIRGWITRLRGTSPVSQPKPLMTSDVVERALADAETLIESQGATSGVDRVHTAFHGFLLAVCQSQKLSVAQDASITDVFGILRDQHPAFAPTGARAEDLKRIIRSMAAIVDALNPLRNRASVAHPNEGLLEAPEAMLVINAVRTLLHYIDNKLNVLTVDKKSPRFEHSKTDNNLAGVNNDSN